MDIQHIIYTIFLGLTLGFLCTIVAYSILHFGNIERIEREARTKMYRAITRYFNQRNDSFAGINNDEQKSS